MGRLRVNTKNGAIPVGIRGSPKNSLPSRRGNRNDVLTNTKWMRWLVTSQQLVIVRGKKHGDDRQSYPPQPGSELLFYFFTNAGSRMTQTFDNSGGTLSVFTS